MEKELTGNLGWDSLNESINLSSELQDIYLTKTN
jgi:hypothetical protein